LEQSKNKPFPKKRRHQKLRVCDRKAAHIYVLGNLAVRMMSYLMSKGDMGLEICLEEEEKRREEAIM
jgi:hypothetical protein